MKLVQFSAPNCQSCVTMKTILSNLNVEFESRSVLDNIELTRKLNIRKAPALFYMDDNDQVIMKFEKEINQTNLYEFVCMSKIS